MGSVSAGEDKTVFQLIGKTVQQGVLRWKVRRMPEIIRIVIEVGSGYGPVYEAYTERITVTENSISYEYLPEEEPVFHRTMRWSYEINSPIFKRRFADLGNAVAELLCCKEVEPDTDLEVTSFFVTCADKSKRERSFILSNDFFEDCFAIVRKMVPDSEYVPGFLHTGRAAASTKHS